MAEFIRYNNFNQLRIVDQDGAHWQVMMSYADKVYNLLQTLQLFLQWTCIQPGFLSHSPSSAQPLQLLFESLQSRNGMIANKLCTDVLITRYWTPSFS
jgi:hypothetical protein